MVNCANCGEKIGFFKTKYNYEDEHGTSVKMCQACHEKLQEEHKKEQKEHEKLPEEHKKEQGLNHPAQNTPEVIFLGKKFLNEKERNKYVFNYYGANPSRYSVNNSDEKHLPLIKECAEEHCRELRNIEKIIRKDIVEPFNKRYFSEEQRGENIRHLTNLINQKMKLNITERDCNSILETNSIENAINLADKEVSKLKNYDGESLAKAFLKISPRAEFHKNRVIVWSNGVGLPIFYKCLDRKKINYDKDVVEQNLRKLLDDKDAAEFETKLYRNNGGIPTIDELGKLSGFDFEKFIAGLFEKTGYTVEITKKTGDQGADIIITKNGVSTAVQAKRYSGKVGNKAVQEVVAAMKYYDCDEAMVITTAEFTKSAFELARINKVQLIDKEGLKQLLDEAL